MMDHAAKTYASPSEQRTVHQSDSQAGRELAEMLCLATVLLTMIWFAGALL